MPISTPFEINSESDEINLTADLLRWQDTIPLGNICDVSQGVVEAPDKVSRKQLLVSGRTDVAAGDGVFVLNKSEYRGMHFNEFEKGLIEPYLDPSDVERYFIKQNVSKFLIYSDSEARRFIAEEGNFKRIRSHLDKFKVFITSSNGPYGLHRPRVRKFFTRPKILFKNMFIEPSFALDEKKRYVGFSFSCIIRRDMAYYLEWVLAILNSRLAFYWFNLYGKKRGAGLDIGVDKLRTFPIKKTTARGQEEIVALVNRIHSITNNDDYLLDQVKRAKVKEYESQIDQMVYEHYGLTPEEIKIVEQGNQQ